MTELNPDALTAIAAAFKTVRDVMDRSADEWLKLHNKVEALHAELERVERERDDYKRGCERAGVCMACVKGPPENWGCSDCLNTTWQGGAPEGYVEYAVLAGEQRDRVKAHAERDSLRAELERVTQELGEEKLRHKATGILCDVAQDQRDDFRRSELAEAQARAAALRAAITKRIESAALAALGVKETGR